MRNLLVLSVVVLAVAAGCSKKKVEDAPAPDMAGATETAQDTNVQSKDMAFDAQGSDSGKIDGLYTINFDYDKSALSAEAKDRAQKNVAWMKANPNAMLQVEGHCDRHGSIEYNLALGERRAKSVKNYMVSLGASAKRLTTISYGKERPLDSAESDSADSKNRRANFVIQK